MNGKKYLKSHITMRVDQPLGSKHPVCNLYYPVNCGYIKSSSGIRKMDVYILGVYTPLEIFEGRCIAVVHRLENDTEKLVVAPYGKSYTDEQIEALIEFQEGNFEHILLR